VKVAFISVSHFSVSAKAEELWVKGKRRRRRLQTQLKLVFDLIAFTQIQR